jgi:putative membrane protein
MNDRVLKPLIWAVSILVPLAVAVLLNPRFPQLDIGFDTSFLPKLNAALNSGVTILLITGYILIRKGKIRQHKAAMLSAFGLSAVFLISYVLYHLSTGHTPYCEAGPVPPIVYYVVLISHIFLSIFIVPMALFTIYRALSERFDRHRKIARITLPLWLYVSITGVLVYFLISPCYA